MSTTAVKTPAFETFTINIPRMDLKRFKGLVKAMGWTFEKGPKTLDDLSDEECWEQLCKTRPDGNVPLDDKENEEFLNWLNAQ